MDKNDYIDQSRSEQAISDSEEDLKSNTDDVKLDLCNVVEDCIEEDESQSKVQKDEFEKELRNKMTEEDYLELQYNF